MFVKLYYYVIGTSDKIVFSGYVIPVDQIMLMSTHFTTIAENVCITKKDYDEGNFKTNELFYGIRVSDDTRHWIERELYLSNRGYDLYITKTDYDKICGIEYYKELLHTCRRYI